ncbi:MAG: hypothetical protein ACD_62C00507G0002 [uncultured bacterium]|nr:MAG: hypothetical protein ACD_62C00507G0002 [uncultured bacterium]
MSAFTLRDDAQATMSLFGNADGVIGVIIDIQIEAADFAQGILGLNEIGIRINEPLGAIITTGFLIGDSREDEFSFELEFVAFGLEENGEFHGSHVLHVDCAAPPDQAVFNDPLKGILGPQTGFARNHIQMTAQQQGFMRTIAIQPGNNVASAWQGLYDFVGNALFFKNFRQVTARFEFIAGRICGVDADEVLQMECAFLNFAVSDLEQFFGHGLFLDQLFCARNEIFGWQTSPVLIGDRFFS